MRQRLEALCGELINRSAELAEDVLVGQEVGAKELVGLLERAASMSSTGGAHVGAGGAEA